MRVWAVGRWPKQELCYIELDSVKIAIKNRVVPILNPSPKKEILCFRQLFSSCYKIYSKGMRNP